jgi:Tfp pilus assembly protein PilF
MPRRIRFLALLLLLSALGLKAGGPTGRTSFELRGIVVPEGDISLVGSQLAVQLHALSGPWSGREKSAVPDTSGKFKYKGVPAGMYLLTVLMPRVARVRRTVDVGPSLADKHGRIDVRIPLAARRRRPGVFDVPANELSLPEAARAEYEKGLHQLRDRNLARAEEHFRRVTDQAPQYYAAWYELGAIASRRERYADAASLYREALRLQPGSFRILVDLGEVLLRLRDEQGALAINTQAVKMRPDDAQAQVQMGYSLMLTGRLREAETHLKEAVALDPANYSYPQLMLAEIYRRRKDLPGVRRELEEFLRLHPDSPKAREIRAALEELRLLPK